MEYGLGHLRLAPRDFWAMTLTEWAAAWAGYREAVTGKGGGGGLQRGDVQRLREMMGPPDVR